jgi:general secretion pathway protein B
MSLILEALNKADRERDNQPKVPDLQTIHGRMVPSAPPKRHGMLYAIIALLVLILFLLLALLVRQQMASSKAAAPASPSVPAAAAPAAPSAAAPPPPVETPAAPDVADIYQDASREPIGAPPDVDTLYNEAPAPTQRVAKSKGRLLEELEAEAANLEDDSSEASEEAISEEPAPKPKKPAAAPKTDTEQLTKDDGTLNEDVVKQLWEETKKQIPDKPPVPNQVTTQIQNVVKDSLMAYKNVPYLHELPESFQTQVPSINYNNHIYSEKGGAVVVNKKTYKAGQEISPGLLLERVAADGVVMEYQGKRFKLNALSSWVNFSGSKPAAP